MLKHCLTYKTQCKKITQWRFSNVSIDHIFYLENNHRFVMAKTIPQGGYSLFLLSIPFVRPKIVQILSDNPLVLVQSV